MNQGKAVRWESSTFGPRGKCDSKWQKEFYVSAELLGTLISSQTVHLLLPIMLCHWRLNSRGNDSTLPGKSEGRSLKKRLLLLTGTAIMTSDSLSRVPYCYHYANNKKKLMDLLGVLMEYKTWLTTNYKVWIVYLELSQFLFNNFLPKSIIVKKYIAG